MKKTAIILLCIFTLSASAVCFATDGDAERGKTLFSDPELSGSTNDKACIQCHQKEDAFQAMPKEKDLEKIINMCITNALAGNALEQDSQEMKDLKSYIQSQTK
jgi:cytochrome c peroxidase